MSEYIEREAFPAADVRPVGLLEQVEWERDTALAQLAEIGKGLGEKMDDVRPVVRGRWISHDFVDMGKGRYTGSVECSVCHRFLPMKENFCPNCGANMREKN